jgi:hypothetical protein
MLEAEGVVEKSENVTEKSPEFPKLVIDWPMTAKGNRRSRIPIFNFIYYRE